MKTRLIAVTVVLSLVAPLAAQQVGAGRGGAEPVQVQAEPAQPVQAEKAQKAEKADKPVDKELAAKAEKQIERLGDEDFQTRQDAYAQLEKMGKAIEPVLRKHEHHKDPEVRSSVRALIGEFEQVAENADHPAVKKIDAKIAAMDAILAELKEAGEADGDKAKQVSAQKQALLRMRAEVLRKVNMENRVIRPGVIRPMPMPMPMPVEPDNFKRVAPGRPVEKGVEDKELKDGALNDKQVEQANALIGKLGDGDFNVRQDATDRLEKMGKPVLPVLKKHTDAKDAEVRERVAALIEKLEGKADADQAGKAQVIVNGQVIQLPAGGGGFEGELPGGGVFKMQVQVQNNLGPAKPAKPQEKGVPEQAPKKVEEKK